MIWTTLTDFDHLSWEGRAVCANCGSTKPKGDEFIYRPTTLDEVNGFPDICGNCIREAAADLGLIESNRVDYTEFVTRTDFVLVQEEAEHSREAMAHVVRDNVRLQDIIDDMNEIVDTRFPDDYEDNDE